jgi:hypothetical protein
VGPELKLGETLSPKFLRGAHLGHPIPLPQLQIIQDRGSDEALRHSPSHIRFRKNHPVDAQLLEDSTVQGTDCLHHKLLDPNVLERHSHQQTRLHVLA